MVNYCSNIHDKHKVSGEWEEYKKRLENLLTLEDIKTFLRSKADLLETLDLNKNEASFCNNVQVQH